MNYRTIVLAISSLTTVFAVTGCNPDDTEPTDQTDDSDSEGNHDDVPFGGDWVDAYNGTHSISNDDWAMGDSLFTFLEVDATEGVIIAENDAGNEYNPGLFTRFDWVVVDDQPWFCQTAYDAADADAARDTAAADASDPANGGCNTFAWSRLYVPLDIRGDWTDNFGGTHSVREWTWNMGETGTFHVSAYSNDDRVIIAQNDAANQYNADLWSRFDWTEQEGLVYFCQTAYAAATKAEAEATEAADPTDPATTGCGGFSWSSLTEAQ